MARQHPSDIGVAQISSDSSRNDVSAHLLATLALDFSSDLSATRLTRREHFGPLLVQKALYPEGPNCCHAIIVHPPGGVVGGDELRMNVNVGDNAQVLLSTPGAAKWYRGNGRISKQHIEIRVNAGAAIEWLPQETILYDQSDVLFHNHIEMSADARYIGSEILCFGRTASGERFTQGRIRQHLSVSVGGKLLWLEQGSLAAGSNTMQGQLGLAGHTVCANLLCVGGPLKRDILGQVRDACLPLAADTGRFGATQMKSVISVRYLGDSSEIARKVMLAAWRVLRPALLGRKATELRIWNT